MDEAYYEELYASMTSLYHLDQNGAVAVGKADLGPLPRTATILLWSLVGVWVLILMYVLYSTVIKKQRKMAHNIH